MSKRSNVVLENRRSKEEADVPSWRVMSDVTGFLLRRATAVMANHYKRNLTAAGLSITGVHGGILMLIYQHPAIAQVELARLLAVEGSTMSLALSRLVDLGYVKRSRAPADKRAVALHLTSSGKELRKRLDRLLAAHQDEVLTCLTAEERSQLNGLLCRIIESAEGDPQIFSDD